MDQPAKRFTKFNESFIWGKKMIFWCLYRNLSLFSSEIRNLQFSLSLGKTFLVASEKMRLRIEDWELKFGEIPDSRFGIPDSRDMIDLSVLKWQLSNLRVPSVRKWKDLMPLPLLDRQTDRQSSKGLGAFGGSWNRSERFQRYFHLEAYVSVVAQFYCLAQEENDFCGQRWTKIDRNATTTNAWILGDRELLEQDKQKRKSIEIPNFRATEFALHGTRTNPPVEARE